MLNKHKQFRLPVVNKDRMTQLVDLHDLRSALPQILRQLKRHEAILVCLDKVPIAQLTVYVPPTPQPSAAPPINPHALTEDILSILDAQSLSRMVGLPLATFTLLHHHEAYSSETTDCLKSLALALELQRPLMRTYDIRRWWQKRNRLLEGRSPIDYLALPWTSGDARSETVFQLIRQISSESPAGRSIVRP